MGRSIVVDVRKAVIAGILAALDDSSISVTYGWQGASDDARREQVFTNNARATHDPAALKSGRNFRTEDMTFDVVVLVISPGRKPEETDTRALEIGQVVEEFIADRKSNELGIAGLNWIRAAEFSLQNLVGPEGSISEATYTFRYNARLT